ncbi:MAG: hypothetical protein ACLTMD_14240 [Clostridium sp.]
MEGSWDKFHCFVVVITFVDGLPVDRANGIWFFYDEGVPLLFVASEAVAKTGRSWCFLKQSVKRQKYRPREQGRSQKEL